MTYLRVRFVGIVDSFAENLRKFLGILPGNPRKFPGIFQRKIWWKCWQLFRGISCNLFWGTMFEEFLVTNSAENPKKMLTKFVEKEPIPRNFYGSYSQDFLKSSSGISWNILSIFLSKFTNQDFDPIVVNSSGRTTLLSLQLFRSITIFWSQNGIEIFDLTEVVMYFVYSDNWIVKKK